MLQILWLVKKLSCFKQKLINTHRAHKSTLTKTIGKTVLEIDDFHSLITEIKHLVKCRPLTYTLEDIKKTPPLRSLDFLNVNTSNFLLFLDNGNPDYNKSLSIRDKLISNWKSLSIKLDNF